jgi:hypothetical protein
MGLRRTLLRWGLRFGLLRSDGGGGGARCLCGWVLRARRGEIARGSFRGNCYGRRGELREGLFPGGRVTREAGELRAEDMSVRTLS